MMIVSWRAKTRPIYGLGWLRVEEEDVMFITTTTSTLLPPRQLPLCPLFHMKEVLPILTFNAATIITGIIFRRMPLSSMRLHERLLP